VTELNEEGHFLFLHPCSESFFPERKGTPQLLKAFTRLVDEGHDVVLRLLFGMKSKPIKSLLATVPAHVRPRLQVFLKAGARPQDEIRNAYLSAHALVAPSRAEGFGMIPLEARACGVPVVQTMCTGHEDHLDPDLDPADWGIIPVSHGDLAPAWGKFGRAPSVDPHDVKVAMRECMERWPDLHRAAVDKARAVGSNWSWTEGTKPLIRWIRQ
jgi:glycosyltransferase involved in cell wall biosynthesis